MGQKKTNNIISFLLLLIASLVLAAASYVMFNDRLIYKYFNLDESQGESVASISSTKNDIRRKQANSFVWVKSFDKDELKNQDNVFTGPSSQTVIDFKDGSEITTHSNTLIVVQSAEKGTIVQKGSISVKLKENVKKKFIINNKPVELTAKKNAYVVIKTDGVNAPIIKVISKEPLQEAVITVTSEDKSIKFTENNLSEVVIEDLKPVENLEEVKVADENHEEITLTKVEQPVAIKEEVKPVELPEIPKVEKEFIEPVREPALSEVKEVSLPKLTGLDLDLGIYFGFTSLNNSIDASDANYIYPRNMLASALFLEFGYQINDFTPYIYGEYRYMGQLTPARSVANQNMAGSGYALGAGLKYKVEDFFISGSYTFLGSYTLAKPTPAGGKSIYSNASGFIFTIGYYIGESTALTLSYNRLSFNTWNLDTSTAPLNQSTYAIGLQYELF